MRTIQPELQARLDDGATTLCRCWKVERRDGMALGFTDHDRDLVLDGLVCLAGSGFDAGALQTANGLSVDNGQVTGALSDAAVSAEDVAAGLYDGAEVRHWLVDWQRPDLRVLLFRGRFGEIRQADGGFQVELRGLTEALDAPVGRTIVRRCHRVLGDGACRVDLDAAAYSGEGGVGASLGGGRLAMTGLDAFPTGWFAQGRLEWLFGANAGLSGYVRSDATEGTSRVIGLHDVPVRPVGSGDRFRIFAGCDRAAGTCRAKFDNYLNFGGFPHIPSDDWVTAYPKDGSNHDGTSLRGT